MSMNNPKQLDKSEFYFLLPIVICEKGGLLLYLEAVSFFGKNFPGFGRKKWIFVVDFFRTLCYDKLV